MKWQLLSPTLVEAATEDGRGKAEWSSRLGLGLGLGLGLVISSQLDREIGFEQDACSP